MECARENDHEDNVVACLPYSYLVDLSQWERYERRICSDMAKRFDRHQSLQFCDAVDGASMHRRDGGDRIPVIELSEGSRSE